MNDVWPAPAWYPGPHDHIYAIGVMTLGWNGTEQMMRRILAHYMSLPDSRIAEIYESIGNMTATDILTAYVEAVESEPPVRSGMVSAIRSFNICRENRNVLVHAESRMQINEDIFQVAKKANRKSHENYYNLDLATLRHICEDINNLENWLVAALNYLEDRQHARKMSSTGDISDLLHLAFPETVAQPNKLTPLPHTIREGARSRPPA